jgi:phospholipid/cholesterol/gamma-HCH transport system permease protein
MTASGAVVEFEPCLDRHAAQGAMHAVARGVAAAGGGRLTLDLARVERFDSAGMGALLAGVRAARGQGVEVRMRGIPAEMLEFLSLLSIDRLAADPAPAQREDLVRRVGGRVEPILDAAVGVIAMAGEALLGIFVWPLRGRRWRLDRLAQELDSAFMGALPIVLLIGFLLGLILAMQSYVQLRMWGADIYMADMVGVSVAYEIGPLMTGIILAARSGSSNAAQLGSMIVSEEIDALWQMGVHPTSYLVIPKVLALAFSVLALGVVFNYIAFVGGALFAFVAADIEPNAYMARTADALSLGSYLLAATKCVVFGWLVGVVGCGLGLRASGGSEGVGRATTNTVVCSIFLIIVVDSLFVAVQQVWPS